MSVNGNSLSTELWLGILRHLVPFGAPTTVAIQSSKVELRPHVIEYRRSLWAACQMSRRVGACAKIYLYQAILIKNCKELLYLFRTLRTVPELRALVRSFSWTGTFPQSDADETECVDLMPSLVAVFASLSPVTEEDTLLHQYLEADNLAAFRFWRLLSVVLAIIPKITTLFLALGRLMPGPRLQQRLMASRNAERYTAEDRERIFSFNQRAYEFRAINALVRDPILTSIGYPILPELQILIVDHISNLPFLHSFNIEYVIEGLKELCPQLRYIQTKDGIFSPYSVSPYRNAVRSTSMRNLLVRKQLCKLSTFRDIQAAYPNLTSLRIVVFDYDDGDTHTCPFEALAKLKHLQYLSIATPHDLSWRELHPVLSMSRFLRGIETLQHLRIDFIWLAARNNPSELFHIASLLPPSIQSLHLLDYWGVTMTGCGNRERHPVFPDNKSALEFLRLVLENLLKTYSLMGLRSLREVKLSSREYGKYLWSGSRRSLYKLVWQFSQAGIRLIVNGHEEAREEEEGWWLNLD
ncbi:hypothetical protein F5Y19DRAFT_161735 [Xylariaceae sp. FL1651]|nr:hypothetical protein F5Y19DRAFT_161735 [Xylariaceae sp. FL1651]